MSAADRPRAARTFGAAEVADLAGVHVETVRRWIRAGRLARLPLPVHEVRVAEAELVRAGILEAPAER